MTTLNLQVGVGGGDGRTEYTPPSNNPGTPNAFDSALSYARVGCTSAGVGLSFNSFFLFAGVSGLSGSTIDSALLKLWAEYAGSGTPETLIAADDQESPSAPTTKEGHDGLTRTAAKVTWDNPALSTTAWVSSPEIKTVIQELADSYDPSTIQILWDDDKKIDADNVCNPATYDSVSTEAAKLDIDYTAGGVTTRRYGLTVLGVG